MEKILKREFNGISVEGFELTKGQFGAASSLVQLGDMESESGFDRLEDASQFVKEWIESDTFDTDYKEWLKDSIEKGAEIYTYYEDWQPIGEIAVYR